MSVLLLADAAAAQTLFLVRHAERADTAAGAQPMMGTDPDLSEAGRTRAASLASMLKDAGISAIFVTEYKRTQQTAAPLAQALGVTPTVVPAKDLPGLIAKLRDLKGHALVVGHSNTVPDVIKGVGGADAPAIADDAYDHLFILPRGGQLVQLRYR